MTDLALWHSLLKVEKILGTEILNITKVFEFSTNRRPSHWAMAVFDTVLKTFYYKSNSVYSSCYMVDHYGHHLTYCVTFPAASSRSRLVLTDARILAGVLDESLFSSFFFGSGAAAVLFQISPSVLSVSSSVFEYFIIRSFSPFFLLARCLALRFLNVRCFRKRCALGLLTRKPLQCFVPLWWSVAVAQVTSWPGAVSPISALRLLAALRCSTKLP